MALVPEVSLEDKLIDRFGPPVEIIGDELKFVCPGCGKKSLFANLEKGLLNCFCCEYGKGERLEGVAAKKIPQPKADWRLQAKMIRFLAERQTITSPTKLYLRQRGIYRPEKYGIINPPLGVEHIIRSKWNDEEMVRSGLFNKDTLGSVKPAMALHWDRILIPYVADGEVWGAKSREWPRGEKTRFCYVSTRGSMVGSRVYCPRPLMSGDDLIVTEGELKAVTAWEEGYPTIGFSGMSTSERSLGHYRKMILAARPRRITVVFDTPKDPEDMRLTSENADKVRKMFPGHTRVMWLPSKGGKVDLDSFLMAEGRKELDRLIEDEWRR